MSKKKILLLFRSSYIIDQFYPKIAFDILQIFENVPLYFILYLEEHFECYEIWNEFRRSYFLRISRTDNKMHTEKSSKAVCPSV